MKLLNLEEYLTPESIKVHDINQWDSFLFNLLEEGNLKKVITGETIGTKVVEA
jgi:isopentenyl phosphate kinase